MGARVTLDPEAQERRVDELASRLDGIERRLALLEAASRAEAPQALSLLPEGPTPSAASTQRLVPLLGRTLLVLAGGYLLRSVADTGAAPVSAAAVAGLVYAGAWLLRADREAGQAARRPSATFHGLAALAIALPLVLESALRYRALGAAAASFALVLTVVACVVVGIRRELAWVAWSAAVFGVTAGLVLLAGARETLPAVFGVLGMAAAVEGLTTTRGRGLRWPAALGADVAVLACLARALREGGPPEGYAALPLPLVETAALALPLIYVASEAKRTLVGGSQPGAFELLQMPAALLIGLGGAARALDFGAISTGTLGAVVLALGGAFYLAAFLAIDRRPGQSRTFYSYTTAAAILTSVGCIWLARGGLLAPTMAILGLGAVGLGLGTGRRILGEHGVLYLLGCCAATGLLTSAGRALAAPALPPAPGLEEVAALLACLAAYAALLRSAERLPGGALAARLLLATGLAWSVAGLGAQSLSRGLLWAVGHEPGAGMLATARTAALSALAVALTAVARRGRGVPELAWLVPVVLIGAGAKVVLQDFRHGEPLSLFLTLALYGGTLIATSRLGRSSETSR
ncbi:MAG TPA: hypothetical protein VFM88_20610 [Vicinamibacteria bacterium]|nr:hypothetical protein [Vicinamibacteria bacterium]